MYRQFTKRVIDIVLSLLLIALLFPLLGIVALLVRLRNGRPVLFRQLRPGLHEKLFVMYKFRTMTDERDESGCLLPDGLRLTRLGRFLRSTSLDELPELVNVLRGDMSTVGPRPLLVKDLVFMTPDQGRRHDVLPGITGLAQINGRNSASWEKKLDLDLQYVRDVTFLLDIRIMTRTIAKVIGREGIIADGMNTAEDLGDYLLRNNLISLEEYRVGINRAQRMMTG